MGNDAPSWLADAVAEFGVACEKQLRDGEREANLRRPLASLLDTASMQLYQEHAVFHDEFRDTQRGVRPDWALRVAGTMTGYIEAKAPGRSIDPADFRRRELRQWNRLQDVPNLLYSNGTEWRLYRLGDPCMDPVTLVGGSLDNAGSALTSPPAFLDLLKEFLWWQPKPITSVGALVRGIAPLTRLLRGDVIDQLTIERQRGDRDDQPFLGLVEDWKTLLFPDAEDEQFADGYAQTVTFALLLAKTLDVEIGDRSLHDIGMELGQSHTLMGRALNLLTDHVEKDFTLALDLLKRVISSIDWPRVRRGKRDAYLHLYEHFLELYDPELRKASGTYYTPHEIVDEMVRLADDVLVGRLDIGRGFADESVLTVDPAMGTGAYLQTVLGLAADRIEDEDGAGAVPAGLADVARRCVGFELQMGPYAVAELRTAEMLAGHGVDPAESGPHLFVTNTLDNPYDPIASLGSEFEPIARSRRVAAEFKREANVTVVIGNPPYGERAQGQGGWVEAGGAEHGVNAAGILERFRLGGNGRHEYVMKNQYIYFWRWATWKVWESTPTVVDGDPGVVCFITTAGYLRGPGFMGMRKYLRKFASEGWIIDLTPEGQTPDVATRVFPGVRQELAIAIFVRKPDASIDVPARIHYRALSGRRQEKFDALARVGLDDHEWRAVRTDWTAPFSPAADTAWDEFPALNDLMPWTAPGVKPNRTWVYAPSPEILQRRWRRIVSESDQAVKEDLFKETRDSSLDRLRQPLPGVGVVQFAGVFRDERRQEVTPVQVAYRSFDRQRLIPDARLLDTPRPPLWSARIPGQVFVSELHSHALRPGPGVTFSALIQDMHHFKGSEGGRVLPLLHPDGSPNVPPHLLQALRSELNTPVDHADLLAYIAGVVAHPAYTERFTDELVTPGIRVPLTADGSLWREAVALGEQVIWLHAYGDAFTGPDRPPSIRLQGEDPRQPRSLRRVDDMPETLDYDEERRVVLVDTGEFGPVDRAIYDYTVGGRSVIKSWFNYRKRDPGGRKSSDLDKIHGESWPWQWTREFIDLLTVLTRLVDLELAQANLLDRIMEGRVMARSDLGGVQWPRSATDRRPRHRLHDATTAGDQQTIDLTAP